MKSQPFLSTKKAVSVFIEYTEFGNIPANTTFFDVDENKWEKIDKAMAVRIVPKGQASSGGIFYSHEPVTVLTTTSPSG
jgi:hypothetical protein